MSCYGSSDNIHIHEVWETYLRRGAFSSMSSRVSKDDLWEMRRRLQRPKNQRLVEYNKTDQQLWKYVTIRKKKNRIIPNYTRNICPYPYREVWSSPLSEGTCLCLRQRPLQKVTTNQNAELRNPVPMDTKTPHTLRLGENCRGGDRKSVRATWSPKMSGAPPT